MLWIEIHIQNAGRVCTSVVRVGVICDQTKWTNGGLLTSINEANEQPFVQSVPGSVVRTVFLFDGTIAKILFGFVQMLVCLSFVAAAAAAAAAVAGVVIA